MLLLCPPWLNVYYLPCILAALSLYNICSDEDFGCYRFKTSEQQLLFIAQPNLCCTIIAQSFVFLLTLWMPFMHILQSVGWMEAVGSLLVDSLLFIFMSTNKKTPPKHSNRVFQSALCVSVALSVPATLACGRRRHTNRTGARPMAASGIALRVRLICSLFYEQSKSPSLAAAPLSQRPRPTRAECWRSCFSRTPKSVRVYIYLCTSVCMCVWLRARVFEPPFLYDDK